MWFRRVYSIVDMTSGNKCCEDIQHFYLIASRFQRIKTNKQTNKKIPEVSCSSLRVIICDCNVLNIESAIRWRANICFVKIDNCHRLF
jgi:hypothetical protein